MRPKSIDLHLQLKIYYVGRPSYKFLQLDHLVKPFWIISRVLKGEVVTTTLGDSYPVQPGEVMIHPPQVAFSENAPGAGQHEVIYFDAKIWPNIDLFDFYPISPVIRPGEHSPFPALFEQLLQTWQATPPYRDLIGYGLLAQLLAALLDGWLETGAISRKTFLATSRDRFTPVISYMSQHLAQKISRDRLAEMVHLNPSYFDRVFAETYGIAPTQMLREMRLQQARQLLETTDEALQAIAEACGFDTAPYFCRIFRRHFGQTPGQYRKNTRKNAKSYLGAEPSH